MTYTDVHINPDDGSFSYTSDGMSYLASLDLFLIRQAWDAGVDYEDLADGFALGFGTNGDWSAIRDSTNSAKSAMLERALNHFFGDSK